MVIRPLLVVILWCFFNFFIYIYFYIFVNLYIDINFSSISDMQEYVPHAYRMHVVCRRRTLPYIHTTRLIDTQKPLASLKKTPKYS